MSSSVASARTQFYHPVAGVNVRTLPLLPEQAFVLSRVDGQSDEAAIARATGIPAPQVFLHLQRLEELGAVRRPASIAPPKYGKAAAQPSDVKATPKAPGPVPALARPTHAPGATTTAPAPAPETDKVVTTPAPTGPRHPEIDETLSLSVELQARILDLSERLGDLDHFQVLGVPHGSDRTAIKRAYFAMIGTFHPDSYFGKKLGGFTRRMEKIFQRLTEAHDVLSNARTREEYEAYLGAVGRTRGFETPSQPPPSVEDLERLLQQAENEARKSPPPATPPAPAPAVARVATPAAPPPPRSPP